MTLKLTDCIKNNFYRVRGMNLPLKTEKRLEALGMTAGTEITVLNKKKSALIVVVRGTRFALGRAIARNIEIDSEAVRNDNRFYRKSELRKNYSF